MKKSKLLAQTITHLNTYSLHGVDPAATREFFKWYKDPCNWREPVYAWLLKNFDEVQGVRERMDNLTWAGIARIMAEDGVIGSRGQPPNANSVRRCWIRVCRDKITREEWEKEREALKA